MPLGEASYGRYIFAMSTALVADIGGTNSRFAIAQDGRLSSIRTFSNDRADGIAGLIAAYLSECGVAPIRAVLALAGPVRGGSVRLTNRDWLIDADALARRFGFAEVVLLNDFAALAHALPVLDATGLALIGSVPLQPQENKVVLGPGTGLGVAALLVSGGAPLALATEAGHMELAAVSEREEAVFGLMRRQGARVSAEHVLSGRGLSRIDAALAVLDGDPGTERAPSVVTEAAQAGEVRAREAAGLFLDALARFAGDVALAYLARGGVYLAGGVTGRLAGLIDVARFRASFEAKSPHEQLMHSIGTARITALQPGLIGCAAFARLMHQ